MRKGWGAWSAPTVDASSVERQPSAAELEAHSLILSALSTLQNAAAEQAPAARQRSEHLAGLLQLALAQASPEPEVTPLDPRYLASFARVVRDRRRAAELSQRELAVKVGLCRGTIRNLEAGRHNPSKATLFRLLAIPELGLQVRDIAASAARDSAWKLNSWIAPRYHPVGMCAEMVRTLNSPGGSLEQTCLYLAPQSADDWLSLCNSERYIAEWRDSCPLDQVAARAARTLGSAGVDVVALGAGDGKTEVRLVRHLMELMPASAPRINLNLLDISNALLVEAQRHAEAVVGDRVDVVTSQANFHDISRYTGLRSSARGGGRRMLYTILGYTLANLDNEVRFFSELAECATAGDLLIVDVQIVYAPADRPDEIREKDPVILQGAPTKYADWMTGPIRRHTVGLSTVRTETKLNVHCLVPASYEIQFIAIARMKDGTERRYAAARRKCYEPAALAAFLDGMGWKPELMLKYGPGANKAAVLLLRRSGG